MTKTPRSGRAHKSKAAPIQWPILGEPLRFHVGSGQGYFLLPAGPGQPKRRYYQGQFFDEGGNEPSSRTLDRAARWLAAYRRAGGAPVDPEDAEGVTLAEVADRFLVGLERRGESDSEQTHYRIALGQAVESFGRSPAATFGRAELRAVAVEMARSKRWGRRTLNAYLQRIRRAMREAAHQGLVPIAVSAQLADPKGINLSAREARSFDLPAPRDVRPVSAAVIDATCEELSESLAALVRLQRLTGARCGELVQLTPGLIERNPELPPGAPAGVWTFQPPEHKTSDRGQSRTIYLGPEAQRVVAPMLIRASGQNDPLFKTPAGTAYSTHSVTQAIKRACARAGVERWTAHRLRHTAATEIRRRYGIEGSRVMLEHSDAATTSIYAERDRAAAFKIASEVG
ncbi:MAG: site-specific integrase [Planctomycetota bacterium]